MTDAQKRARDQLWAQYGIDAPTAPLVLVPLFGRDAPRTFEIGFGMGDYLLSRVVAEPQHDFFGVEVHRPGVGRLLHRAQAAGAHNLRVASDDAVVVLRDGVADAALDEIVIQFPDPWHKARHHRSEEHTSELQSLMRTSYAIFCLKKKNQSKARKNETKLMQPTVNVY